MRKEDAEFEDFAQLTNAPESHGQLWSDVRQNSRLGRKAELALLAQVAVGRFPPFYQARVLFGRSALLLSAFLSRCKFCLRIRTGVRGFGKSRDLADISSTGYHRIAEC